MLIQTQPFNDDGAPMPQRAYTIAQAAEVLGIHRATAHRLVQTGKLKPIAGFGRLKVSDVELDRFLNAAEDYRPRGSHD